MNDRREGPPKVMMVVPLEDYEEGRRAAENLGHIEAVMSRAKAQTPPYQPDFMADKSYIEFVQKLCVQAVYSYWYEYRAPAQLRDIYGRVMERIRYYSGQEGWPRGWKYPSKRTVDRRTNEAASENMQENRVAEHIESKGKAADIPTIIGLSGGYYIPNPQRFDEKTRQKIIDIILARKR